MTPLSKVKESLESLNVEEPILLGPTIDVSVITTIRMFRNLVYLDVGAYCHEEGEGQCTFKLNNDDVTALVITLPRLESLRLGYPCSENTCATTVAFFLPISVYCPNLQKLEIRFNTTNIVDDFKNISGDPRFQELLPFPRCPLTCLEVYQTQLTLDEPGIETVVNGMIDIFPSLERCDRIDERLWSDISDRIMELQEMGISPERRW